MATQNSPDDGSTNPQQNMEQGQDQGGQQQPMMNPGPFLITPIVHHDKPKERTKWVAIVDLVCKYYISILC